MKQPNATQLQHALSEIKTHGPLTTGCHFEAIPVISQSEVRYIYDGDDAEPQDYHPLTIVASAELVNPPSLEPTNGHVLPQHFSEAHFVWQVAESVDQAIIDAALQYNRATGRTSPHHISRNGMKREWDSNLATVVSSGKLPKTLYLAGEQDNALPEEDRAAWFAEHLGFALVVVEMTAKDIMDFFTSDEHATSTRYSMSQQSEKLKPLYVGFGLGNWYVLRPREKEWFDAFHPNQIGWNKLYAEMRERYGIPLTLEGFKEVTVRMQHLCRVVSSDEPPQDLDGFFAKYTQALLEAKSPSWDILSPMLTESVREDDPVLTFHRITMTVACAEDKQVMRLASQLDQRMADANDEPTQAAFQDQYFFNIQPMMLGQTEEPEAPKAGENAVKNWRHLLGLPDELPVEEVVPKEKQDKQVADSNVPPPVDHISQSGGPSKHQQDGASSQTDKEVASTTPHLDVVSDPNNTVVDTDASRPEKPKVEEIKPEGSKTAGKQPVREVEEPQPPSPAKSTNNDDDSALALTTPTAHAGTPTPRASALTNFMRLMRAHQSDSQMLLFETIAKNEWLEAENKKLKEELAEVQGKIQDK